VPLEGAGTVGSDTAASNCASSHPNFRLTPAGRVLVFGAGLFDPHVKAAAP